MKTYLQEFLDQFIALGGVAENIFVREGENGRGVFPSDSSKSSKIMTPRNLLVNTDNLEIRNGEIMLRDKSLNSLDEINFLENYYNEYSWGNNGNSDSSAFLMFVASLPQSIQDRLLINRFIDEKILNYKDNEEHILKRFIDERAVGFKGQRVLVPVWELVNHNSFSHPIRITPFGIETPPMIASSQEIMHCYSKMNSPISIWKKYGFSCDCIVAYSVPFEIQIGSGSLAISCLGQLGLDHEEKRSFSAVGNKLQIKSLPIGCLSIDLPQKNFNSIISSVGLSEEIADRLFPRIREANIKVRRDLINALEGSEQKSQNKSELHKALIREIDLIESSLTT